MSQRDATFELGSVVGDRRIDSIAGQGGMGIVYRAWNLRLKRVEAVKVIADEYARDESFRVRFARETEIAANINHPHVVTLYDSGESADGQLFIAMQYVEGTTLERLIRDQRRLSPLLAAELIAQVADALDTAHDQGLVHRDIKPANILIGQASQEYDAYLTDFGLAKRVSSDSLTGGWQMVGTIDYMPPEQARRGQRVDLRSDVYSLGATLYFALTGQVPFPGDDAVPKLLARFHEEPPKPSAITRNLPEAFDAVISKAMASDRDARFGSAGELGAAALAAAGSRSTGRGRRERRGVPATEIVVGSMIDGRYRIDAEAGAGGMAVVYQATHLKLAKRVALKVMNPTLAADLEFQRRFEDEARAASEIDHENVIPVYDFGEDEHGLYLVMRYVDTNLQALLRSRGAFEPAQAVRVLEQVASALDAAHERGLLHRDIKPANILVDESTSRIFLADFGLVRSAGSDQGMTGSRILGTDWYMAPERRNREETKLGDIYSLGHVFWETLAGPGVPLPGRTSTSTETSVPPALMPVVDRAVSERPLLRYETAGAFAQAARAALAAIMEPAVTRQHAVSAAFFEPLTNELSTRVLEVCQDARRGATSDAADQELQGIIECLSEPLRLAVAGRVSAGKSTLVNALIGRLIKRIETSDGQPVLTTFRYGDRERLELALSDGQRLVRELAGATALPDDISGDELESVEIWLNAPALAALTIVDTPGTNATALDGADALLFAIPGDSTGEDQEALRAFRRQFEGTDAVSAINAIGVLTKADLLAADAAGWDQALARAESLRTVLGSLITTVVPVAGQIAETVAAEALSPEDLAALERWANLGPARRERLLYSDEGEGLDPGRAVTSAQRARLLKLLGRYGVRLAVDLVDSGDPFNVVTLTRRLRELSGIGELSRQIDAVQLRTDAIKADTGLSELESFSWRHQQREVRNAVDRIRLDAPILELIRLFDQAANGRIELPADRLSEIECLLTGRTRAERTGLRPDASPDEVHHAATLRARGWRTWAAGGQASLQARQVANKVDDVYMQIAFPE
jgi:serine/threonine protein kinase